MLVLERTIRAADDDGREAPAVVPPRRAWPLLVMAAGLALVVASLALVHRASTAPAPGPAPASMTIGGPADVTVQRATYEPGQTSRWHTHSGMHAVLVLSGSVTFYDEQCRGRAYGPGDSYVGGQLAHVVRNETDQPAQLAVTYLFSAGQPHTTFHVDSPAPAGCDAG